MQNEAWHVFFIWFYTFISMENKKSKKDVFTCFASSLSISSFSTSAHVIPFFPSHLFNFFLQIYDEKCIFFLLFSIYERLNNADDAFKWMFLSYVASKRVKKTFAFMQAKKFSFLCITKKKTKKKTECDDFMYAVFPKGVYHWKISFFMLLNGRHRFIRFD